MENIFTFRNIKTSDYERCKNILSQLTHKNEDFNIDKFSRLCSFLNSNHRIICCIYHDIEAEIEIIVGMSTIFIEPKLIHNCSCVGHIEDVVVDEKYRKMNVGKLMINELVNYAKQRGAYKVILDCDEDKVGFYRRCGFYKSSAQMRINI
tara:strand:- start:56 stop:505 length:450 start_codon:yes stop_codon:yes gene_type:complete